MLLEPSVHEPLLNSGPPKHKTVLLNMAVPYPT